uniref:Uncharacterized protein n=1 Tax=Panagrolaimus superbus TaxID=310955 RepID=A0A914YPQ0_9BILA
MIRLEFQELFEKAERQLSHYRKRTHSADPRQRYWSTKSHQPHSSNITHQQQQQQQQRQQQDRLLESEDINRSKSVLDYNSTVTTQQESSTRRGWYSPKAEGNHTRSKSADMLMDQKAREISAAPENELQKQGGVDDVPVTEYEHRFRKSVEKMQVPDWYRDYSSRQLQQHQTATTTQTQTRYDLPPTSQAWSYTNPPLISSSSSTQPPPPPLSSSQSHQQHYQQHHSQQQQQQHRHSTSPPVGGIAFPTGMFDKYKDEIEDMRRSRTSLHQIGQSQPEHTKVCVL